MTLGRYIQLIKAVKNAPQDEIEASITLVSAWYDISIDDVKRMPINEFNEKLKHIDYNSLKLPDDAKLPYKVTIGGKKYRIMQLFSEMSFGQFVDMQIALKDLYDDNGNINWDAVPKVIACFIQDEQKKYIPGVDVLDVGIIDAWGILLFFYKFKKQLLKLTRAYLNRKAKNGDKIHLPLKSLLN